MSSRVSLRLNTSEIVKSLNRYPGATGLIVDEHTNIIGEKGRGGKGVAANHRE